MTSRTTTLLNPLEPPPTAVPAALGSPSRAPRLAGGESRWAAIDGASQQQQGQHKRFQVLQHQTAPAPAASSLVKSAGDAHRQQVAAVGHRGQKVSPPPGHSAAPAARQGHQGPPVSRNTAEAEASCPANHPQRFAALIEQLGHRGSCRARRESNHDASVGCRVRASSTASRLINIT